MIKRRKALSNIATGFGAMITLPAWATRWNKSTLKDYAFLSPDDDALLATIVDTNHSNSGKKFKEQIRIAKEVMHNRQLSSDIKSLVKGLMIESYIEEGSQKIGEHVYGKSITDPCLGWEDSKKLIYDIAEMNS